MKIEDGTLINTDKKATPREILINRGYPKELVSQWDDDYCKEELEEMYCDQAE